jgi:hypothetical protein
MLDVSAAFRRINDVKSLLTMCEPFTDERFEDSIPLLLGMKERPDVAKLANDAAGEMNCRP